MIKIVAEFMLAALFGGARPRSGPRTDAPSMVRLSRSLVSVGKPIAIGRAANENDVDGRLRSRVHPF